MQVDLQTLYLLCCGTLVVAGAMAFWESMFNRARRRELRTWTLAYASLCIGCALLYARARMPSLVHAGFANIFVITGYGLMVVGIARMGGRRAPKALPVACLATAVLWLWVGPQLAAPTWNSVGSLAIAIVQFAGVAALSSKALKPLRSRPLAVAVFLIHFTLYAARAVAMPFLDESTPPELLALVASFTMYEGVLYSVAAPMVLLAMVREEGENRLLKVSQTDFLTGLPNRRAFMSRVNEILASQKPSGTLLLLDLDHFKQINDVYGHQVGDEVLRLFADVMEAELGTQDVAARLGGEEFAAFLPGCDAREGEAVAGRIGRRFSQAAAAGVGPHQIHVTVSTGLTVSSSRTIGEMIAVADRALYRAKRLGRNRVEREEPLPLAA